MKQNEEFTQLAELLGVEGESLSEKIRGLYYNGFESEDDDTGYISDYLDEFDLMTLSEQIVESFGFVASVGLVQNVSLLLENCELTGKN